MLLQISFKFQMSLNRPSRRNRGMASNPLFNNTRLFCIFPKNFAMATLGLKEMGKFLWEGREKSLPSWLSQLSFAKLRPPTGQTFFPKEFPHFLQTYGSHSWVLLESNEIKKILLRVSFFSFSIASSDPYQPWSDRCDFTIGSISEKYQNKRTS